MATGDMLNEFAVLQLCEQITYKPGWRFDYDLSTCSVRMRAALPTSRHADRHNVRAEQRHPVPFLCYGQPIDEDYFLGWLSGIIMQLELHEHQEWLAVDGVLVHRPHGEPEPVVMAPPLVPSPLQRMHYLR